MDDLDRPHLDLEVIEDIEVDIHYQDMRVWPVLKGLQLPTPETQKAYAPLVFNEGPMPPRRPQKLSKILAEYAAALFQVEAVRYPRLDPQFAYWLHRLAERVEEHVIERVGQVEAGNPTNSLAYHGVSIESMRSVVAKSLKNAVKEWPQTGEYTPPPKQSIANEEMGTQPLTRRELAVAYRAQFPGAKLRDIAWAVHQTYREWTRWLSGEAKDGLKADREFRRILTSGKPPSALRAGSRLERNK
jgi:hypothetical protein